MTILGTPAANPLLGLLRSRKAIVVLVTLICVTVLAALGRVSGEAAMQLFTVLIPSWLLGQSYEDGKAKGATSNVVNQTTDPQRVAESFIRRTLVERMAARPSSYTGSNELEEVEPGVVRSRVEPTPGQ